MLIRDQTTRLPTTGLGGLGKQEKWAAFKVTIQYARDTWVVKGTRIYADPGFFLPVLKMLTAVKAQPYKSLAMPTHDSPCHVTHHGFPNAGRNHQAAPLQAVSIGI